MVCQVHISEKNRVSTTTAWRLRRDGKFPFPTRKVGKTLFVCEDEEFHRTDEIPICPHCGKNIEVEVFIR